ncbi:MAG TPA: SGNH/GDSL hydrolase family protein [Albitalea sp.]|nr:SGNH/GDSL hydrolase family protein [Albitalea sp.]
MNFKGVQMRASVFQVLGAMAAALLLASCGGGQQVEKFAPTRVLAFGDENSLIVDDKVDANGYKYTVNFKADASAQRDCIKNPIWVQVLAGGYGLVFPQCNPTHVATTSQILAVANTTSGDVKRQVDEFVKTGSFGGKDLVTVMAGSNDILAQYALIDSGAKTEAQATADLEQAGTDLAGQVNRIAQAGGKVLITTVQDMGLTAFAATEKAAHSDYDRAALLTRLTQAFNTLPAKAAGGLRINLINDGHMIGLLLHDEQIQSIAASGWIIDKGACAVPLTTCDTFTPISDSRVTAPATPTSVSSWLWADATHMSFGAHATLGSLALTRATNNPF